MLSLKASKSSEDNTICTTRTTKRKQGETEPQVTYHSPTRAN